VVPKVVGTSRKKTPQNTLPITSYLFSEDIFFLKKIVCEAGKGSRKNASCQN